MIRNDYRIDGDSTTIYVKRKNGDTHEVLIDTEDLKIIDELQLCIAVAWHRGTEDYYARMTKYLGVIDGKPRYEILMLHRVIMNAGENEEVDHKEHHTLDNRKKNLRKTFKTDNCKNRKGKNTNNKSGYRNVSWNNRLGRWVVQLQINGVNTVLGTYDDVNEAGKFAEDMREIHYGIYKGKS